VQLRAAQKTNARRARFRAPSGSASLRGLTAPLSAQVSGHEPNVVFLAEKANNLKGDAPTMLDTLTNLLLNHKIPVINAEKMSELLEYLFTTADNSIRVRTAEVAYRYEHAHRNGLDVFLACTLPLAETAAERRARRFTYPTDWQRESMYDGAVAAAIDVFQRSDAVAPGAEAFRHFLARALVRGVVRSFHTLPQGVARNSSQTITVRSRRAHRRFRNLVEERVIARNLLREVTGFRKLGEPLSATLKCIAALGPHRALKEQSYRAIDESAGWGQRQYVHVLDTAAIATAMRTSQATVDRNLTEVRTALHRALNPDGRLFLNH